MGKSEKDGKEFSEQVYVCQEVGVDDEGQNDTDQNQKLQNLLSMFE